jgi:hypothetical protein
MKKKSKLSLHKMNLVGECHLGNQTLILDKEAAVEEVEEVMFPIEMIIL